MADIGFLADDLTGASDVLAQAHAGTLPGMGTRRCLACSPMRGTDCSSPTV